MNGEWRMVNGELTMDNYFFEKFPSLLSRKDKQKMTTPSAFRLLFIVYHY